MIDRRTIWSDVILPAMPTQNSGYQTMSYVIRGLEPGQSYEAKVQARNKFGWSPISDAFTFQTTETGQYLATCYKKLERSTIKIVVFFHALPTSMHFLG